MIIALIVYVICAIIAYAAVIKNWNEHSTFEKILFSAVWILLLPLYGIHKIYNSCK